MTIEHSQFHESDIEKEKILDLNILSLYHCETIDEMIETIESAQNDGQIDSVLLGEYDFRVEEVLNDLTKIKEFATENGVDIILAPDNHFGRNTTWGELKKEFENHKTEIESTSVPDEYKPETIGIFIGKNGLAYAFPKTWYLKSIHNPVRKIPGTTVGVTICGEINHIKPDDLENITILYNPSREGDDPFLKYRMLKKYGNASKEDIAKALEQ